MITVRKSITLSFLFLCCSLPFFAKEPDFETRYIQNGDTKLFCRTIGSGPPLIIIHGGPGGSQNYLLPHMATLAKTNFVIFYDQRGCGNSSGPINDETINIDHFVEDIEAIRKGFLLEKISVLGHSWGGHLALLYALSHQEHLDKLILLNPMPASSEDFSLFADEWTQRLSAHMDELNSIKNSTAFLEGDPKSCEQYFLTIFRRYCFDPKMADRLNFMLSRSANLRGIKISEIFERKYISEPFDLLPRLEQILSETLIIHGDADPIPLRTVERIHKSMKNSSLVVIKQCGHFPYVEKPTEFFDVTYTFLLK